MDALPGIALEYVRDARRLHEQSSFNSAAKLYGNAVYAALDYYLQECTGEVVEYHTHRERLLRNVKPGVLEPYKLVFTHYKKSYKQKRRKHHVDAVKDAVEHIFESIGFTPDNMHRKMKVRVQKTSETWW